jgi:hypothetical protein
VRILEDRRVVHALKALAALRHSEASALRWRQYDTRRGTARRAQPRKDQDAGSAPRSGPPDARPHPSRLARGRLGADLRPRAHGRRLHRPDPQHDRATQPHVHHARPGRRRPPRPPRNHHVRAARQHHQRLHDLPVAGAMRRGREAKDPQSHRWGHETGVARLDLTSSTTQTDTTADRTTSTSTTRAPPDTRGSPAMSTRPSHGRSCSRHFRSRHFRTSSTRSTGGRARRFPSLRGSTTSS